jgi:minor histocompatibility antigen H13
MAESDPGLLAQILGRAAYEFAQMQPMLPTYIHLIVSALFPIYAGAHASLSRPSTAAKPTKKKSRQKAGDEETDDEDEEEEQRVMEGLSPTDALLMPLFAGAALATLYFLLKWMKDPALLNKILNAYFAIFGVFSVSRLITDMLDIGHSIIFPQRYALGGVLYHVLGKEEAAAPIRGATKDKPDIMSPLPGFLARIPLPERVRQLLWADRAMPGQKWTLKLYLHRVFAGKFQVGPHDIVGVVAALTTVAYFNLVDKPWYLTNLLGFGFSYGALQLMSPTTFATGSLILGALFFYDIYFVFFT